jgi:hypothetical protein
VRHAAWHEYERAGVNTVRRITQDELHDALDHQPRLVVASVSMRCRAWRAGGRTGRPAADHEAETFSALTSPELHHLMSITRGWTQQGYSRWLEQTLTSLISVGTQHDAGTSGPAG